MILKGGVSSWDLNVLCTPEKEEETEEEEEEEKAGGEMKLQSSHKLPYRVVGDYEVIANSYVLLTIISLTITRATRRDTTRQLPLSVTRPALILLLTPSLVLTT